MSRYAQNTEVSTGRSRDEIERILRRYGASHFGYAVNENQAMIGFKIGGRAIKSCLPLPDRADRKFWHTPSRSKQRSQEAAYELWEQASRQRWRALALSIKAKLEAVETGIASFETEFLPFIVLPSGRTVGETIIPELNSERLTNGDVKLLLE